MKLLALDTSAALASAALLEDGRLVSEKNADPAHKHAETALPLLRTLLDEAGWSMQDVDYFAVDIGPGSFTGVRIGVCAINAMAFALHKPVIAVDSLAALYEPYARESGRFCTLIDAGSGNCYAAQFEAGACLAAPDAFETGALLSSLQTGTRTVQDAIPSAANVALAAWRLRGQAQEAALPLYVRPSQAERLYDARQNREAGKE